jgi:hypothetical protein
MAPVLEGLSGPSAKVQYSKCFAFKCPRAKNMSAITTGTQIAALASPLLSIAPFCRAPGSCSKPQSLFGFLARYVSLDVYWVLRIILQVTAVHSE